MTEYDGAERSTATETFRAMLDERGVEWMPVAWNPKKETFYHTSNGVGFCADEYADGVKIYTDATITPEQAIAATLGTGTCHDSNKRFGAWQCSECGATLMLMFDDFGEPTYSVDGVGDVPKFCPNCGARCVG